MANPNQNIERQQPSKESGQQIARPLRRELTPFSFVGRMMDEMDRIFGVGPLRTELRNELRNVWSPQIDVREKDGKLFVKADLPGVSPDDVELELKDDTLFVRGERIDKHEEKREGLYHSEVSYGRFERAIPLPQGTDANAIEAKFENGVLEIVTPLPKAIEGGKKIAVKGQTQKAGEKKAQH
ncbi:MAG: Hsp20/alpha crystallin family protein [Polyangiales bacterium]